MTFRGPPDSEKCNLDKNGKDTPSLSLSPRSRGQGRPGRAVCGRGMGRGWCGRCHLIPGRRGRIARGGGGRREREEASRAEEAQRWAACVCSTPFIGLVQVFTEGLLGRVLWYPILGSVHRTASLPKRPCPAGHFPWKGDRGGHLQRHVCLRRIPAPRPPGGGRWLRSRGSQQPSLRWPHVTADLEGPCPWGERVQVGSTAGALRPAPEVGER